MSRERTVEVYQVAQEEEEVVAAAAAAAAAGLALEHCSEEHNYSLSQGEELGAGPGHNSQTEGVRLGETRQEARGREESHAKTELNTEDEEQDVEEDDDDDEEEEEGEEAAEETAVEAELSSSSETECGELCSQFASLWRGRRCSSRRLPTPKPLESVSGPDLRLGSAEQH